MIKLFKMCIFSFFTLLLINSCFAQIELFHKIMPQKVVDGSGEEQFVPPDVKISVFNKIGYKFLEGEMIPALIVNKVTERRESVASDSDGFPDDLDLLGINKVGVKGKALVFDENEEDKLFMDMEKIKKKQRDINDNKIKIEHVDLGLNAGFVFPDNGDSFMVKIKDKAFFFKDSLNSKGFSHGVFFASFDVKTKKVVLSLRELVNNQIGNEILCAYEI